MKKESSLTTLIWSITYLALIVFVLLGALVPRNSVLNVLAPPDQRKSVEEAFTFTPQVRVSGLKVGAVARGLKEQFDESDDWPKRLSFEVESIAAKPIVYLEVNLNFPETKSSGSMMSYPIKLGVRPDVQTSVTGEPLLLMPGEKLNFNVSEHYERLEHFISGRHSMNQIRRAQIEIGFIIFQDGTAWAGDFMRPDPAKPGRYIPVGRSPQNK